MRSLGQLLKNAREKRHLTHEGIYTAIKIHPRFLKALENDDYNEFSSKVHAKGFLKLYAELLGLDVDDVLALWRREYEKDLEGKDAKPIKRKWLKPSDFTITPVRMFAFAVSALIIVFFGYLFFQYRNSTGAPNLEVYSPVDNIVATSDILDVIGKTDLDSEVFLNGQRILLSPNGSFATSIKLKEGLNTIDISSTNKLSKKSEIVRTVIYRPVDTTRGVSETPESSPSER